jgi:hypothetical protein
LSGDDLDALGDGFEVSFDEGAGDQVPQATFVKVIGKHRIAD